MNKPFLYSLFGVVCIACIMLGYGIFGITIKNKDENIFNLTQEQQLLVNQLNVLTENNRSLESKINEYKIKFNNSQTELDTNKNRVKELEEQIQELNRNAEQNQEEITRLTNEKTQLELSVKSKEDKITQLQSTISELTDTVSEKEARIQSLVEQLNSDNDLFKKLMSAEITEIKASDFGDITEIRPYCFYGCKQLQSVELPNTLERIGESAFSYCESLTTIDFPQDLTDIGDSAFSNCKGLTTINLPQNLSNIGYSVFRSCIMLNNVVLPENLISINISAFIDCKNLKNISFNEYLESIENDAFARSGIERFDCSNCYNLYSIGTAAFEGCSNLSEVILSENVSEVGFSAFEDCTNLSSVILSNSLSELPTAMFNGCTLLDNVVLPSCVTSIGNMCFEDCSNLTNFTFNENLESIGNYAFARTNLSIIKIPDTVRIIFDSAFSGIQNLSELTLPNNEDFELPYYLFSDRDPMENSFTVIIPEKIKLLRSTLFDRNFECFACITIKLEGKIEQINDRNCFGSGYDIFDFELHVKSEYLDYYKQLLPNYVDFIWGDVMEA